MTATQNQQQIEAELTSLGFDATLDDLGGGFKGYTLDANDGGSVIVSDGFEYGHPYEVVVGKHDAEGRFLADFGGLIEDIPNLLAQADQATL